MCYKTYKNFLLLVFLSSSPTSHYPMMMLPSGQAVPLLPGPVHVPSVINVRPTNSPNKLYFNCIAEKLELKLLIRVYLCISSCLQLARPMCMVPNIPGIPGPPLGGSSSGSNSPSGYSIHSEAKMVSTRLALYIYLFICTSCLHLHPPAFLCTG